MRIAGWKAWYTNGRVYRSSIDQWEALPKVGALCILVFYDKNTSDGHPYKDILAGNRRYFMAIGSSGELMLKPSLWKENKLIATYSTKPEWIKEGVWDDDTTIERINREALNTNTWE